ncbi:MAG TPA: hypothetical protein DEF34_00405 [Desulfotomaculum sp.]|nr:MAG: hypothetical protein VR67_08210 [Peptococcaceae bacterium BRH_c8a]KJS78613.1 MAG: hypothetical protein JL56_00870 [Desulfotomaculum sp. BICA1-6]HBX22087.1 hypothetical protein [Desulfotomaculum sp.]
MLLTLKSTEPELVLACQVGPSFKTNPNLEDSLQQILQTSVQSFGFGRATFVLVRSGKAPVWWHAENKLMPKENVKKDNWHAWYENLNRSGGGDINRLLDPLNPTAYTTLPVILQAGNPVGTMEVGIFNTDPDTAEYMLIKALSLGRHMADIIQESLFGLGKNHKFRNVAAWMEMISTISSTLDIRQVLHVVAQLTADWFLARSCILMLDENDHTLIPAVAVGSYDTKLKERFKALKNYPPFKAITMAIKTQRPVVVTPDNIYDYVPANIVEDFNYNWMVFAPMIKNNKIIGILQVDRPYGPVGFDAEAAENIFAVARATAIAIENARLVEVLGQKEQLLHQLVNKIITAQEDERKRLASDLHDGIIQSMIAIWYRLQRVSAAADKIPAEWRKEVSGLTMLLGEQIQDIRRILYDLRPIILDNYGLVPAIKSCIEKIQEQHDFIIELTMDGEDVRFPPQIEITLFRILQEALTNVVKHSGATLVKVAFSAQDKEIIMSITDNGLGLKKPALNQSQTQAHLGLASIQERALLLNGSCSIDSRSGAGTRVEVIIPLLSGPGNN